MGASAGGVGIADGTVVVVVLVVVVVEGCVVVVGDVVAGGAVSETFGTVADGG